MTGVCPITMKLINIVLLAVLATIVESQEFEGFRLPNTTVPTHYDVFIDTNVHKGEFDYNGTVKIYLHVLEDTRQLVLHSSRNTIVEVTLWSSDRLSIPIASVETNSEKEFLILNTTSNLSSGSVVVLEIDFTNSINRNDQAGFYRISYPNDTGETKYAAVTQFQACEARSSLPCFDEPAIKTTFDVKIACGVEYHARSNAEISSIKILPDGKKLVSFQRTPMMPTYLLAFLVSDFGVKRTITNSTKQITVQAMARPTHSDQLEYALDASVKIIDELQAYFDYPYEMSKIDGVAIRNVEFAAGAMENWGLVTYLESLFLITDGSSDSRKRDVVTVIAHEFAHQFFGNLLTPEWWSYLWLNEGFATLYEFYLSDRTHPELLIKQRFITDALQAALRVDATASIRPMTHYVETVPQIDSLFDTIAYEKSGSVLRMLQYALGEQTFVKGVRDYIVRHESSAVEPTNLYDSLQSAAAEDQMLPQNSNITTILESWATQAGAPVVTVHRTTGSNTVHFRQERFFQSPPSTENNQTWWIPIFIYTNSSSGEYEKKPLFWMPQGSPEMEFEIPTSPEDILLVNPAQTGYYRVNYDPETWNKLINLLNVDPSSLSPAVRSQLIDDSMSLANAGLLGHETSFRVWDHLEHSADYLPWKAAYENILLLDKVLSADAKVYETFRRYIEVLTKKLIGAYGKDERRGESANDHDARIIAIDLLCITDQWECIFYAITKLNVLQQRAAASIVIRSETEQRWYCNALRRAHQSQIQQFEEALYTGAGQDSLARQYILDSLACVQDTTALRSMMESFAEAGGDDDRNQLGRFLLRAVAESEKGLNVTVDFLVEHSDDLSELLGGRRSVEKLLTTLAGKIIDKANALKLLRLVQHLGVTASLKSTISARLEEQTSLRDRNLHLVRQTLEKYFP